MIVSLVALPLALSSSIVAEEPGCVIEGQVLATATADAVASCDGTIVVAGQPGSVLVYVEESGSWTLEADLAIDTTAADLSLSGDTLFVGEPTADDLGHYAGKVHVFVRSEGVWALQQILLPAEPGTDVFFGWGVAVEGDRAAVGVRGQGDGGAVLVYERSGDVWSQTAELSAEQVLGGPGFGASVSLSGDTLLVSEYAGNGYVFVEADGAWSEQATLALPPMGAGIRSVDTALDGDTAALGHPSLGGARVFVRDGTNWSIQAELAFEAAFTSVSVAVCGDLLVASGNTVHAFVRAGTTWSYLAELPPNPGVPYLFGVAVDGETVATAERRWITTFIEGTFRVYELPPFVAPSVAHRNAGTNPDSYRSTPAYVGQSLHMTVDLTTTGHDMALVIGFDSPFGLTLGGGQTLLCLDLLGSGGELINTGFRPGPVATFDLPVPNDLAYAGFSVCTQAIHAFGVVPFALSNAQDIVLGACL